MPESLLERLRGRFPAGELAGNEEKSFGCSLEPFSIIAIRCGQSEDSVTALLAGMKNRPSWLSYGMALLHSYIPSFLHSFVTIHIL